MSNKKAVRIKAAVVDLDPLSSKSFEVLLKQNDYSTTVHSEETFNARTVAKDATNLLIFNVDNTDDKDINNTRMKGLRDLCRSEDLRNAKIIIASSTPDNEKHQSLLTVNKLDALVKLPLDAMEFMNTIRELKDAEPKRTTWRSSWK